MTHRPWGLANANRIGRMAALSVAKATPRKRRQISRRQEGFGLASMAMCVLIAGCLFLLFAMAYLWVRS